MIRKYFHSAMDSFVGAGKLPLWVVYRAKGLHPARFFHDHNYSEIVLIIHGPARHILDGENVQVAGGDVLIIHPGAIHAYDDTAEMEIVNLVFDPLKLSIPQLDAFSLPLFRRIFPDDRKPYHSANPAAHLEKEDLAEAVRMIRKLDDEIRNPQAGNLFYSLALFMEILVFIARKSGHQKAELRMSFLIGDAIRYLNRHYAEPVELKTLAKIAKMSERSFFRHFHANAGCSPIEYLMKIRLQHAGDLLINSNSSIAEIAEQCGFYDSNYLCKQFRRAFAVSPRSFRQQYRAG